MTQLNHTIVWTTDRQASSDFMVDVMGFDPPEELGPFLMFRASNGVSLDLATGTGSLTPQHYAFLVSDGEFDAIFAEIQRREIPYCAEPTGQGAGEINTRDGGRGVYFPDPTGHWFEIITQPYGSETAAHQDACEHDTTGGL